ncbi:hypothetical protein V1477_018324 [Vespula maculifrons]|uniref:Uncharacterized protein n=1 Tax=Vespula maculifrons TaxID=7453 RepID=A0ABD2AZW0_VESMC
MKGQTVYERIEGYVEKYTGKGLVERCNSMIGAVMSATAVDWHKAMKLRVHHLAIIDTFELLILYFYHTSIPMKKTNETFENVYVLFFSPNSTKTKNFKIHRKPHMIHNSTLRSPLLENIPKFTVITGLR